jgi:hypothetical protein
MIAKAGPTATEDLDAAMTDLREFGACIVTNALDPETLGEFILGFIAPPKPIENTALPAITAMAATITSISGYGTCRAATRCSARSPSIRSRCTS